MTKRPATLVAVAAASLVATGLGAAFWKGESAPGGGAAATAGSLDPAATPTATLAGRDATVTWAQSTVEGSPLGQLPGGGYTVLRYASGDLGTPITPGSGSCGSTVNGSPDPISCTETKLPTGRWRYRVVPTLWSWAAGASPASAAVVVGPDAPTSVTLTNGAGTGNAYVNTSNQSALSFDVGLPSSSLANDTITLTVSDGAASVSAAAAGIAGGGTRSFSGIDASSLADGTLTITAVATSAPGDASGTATLTRAKDTVSPFRTVMTMRDAGTVNGKVDRVVVTFSEALQSYTAGTSPWTLANVPSGGSLASVSVVSPTATLTLTEGAGALDTAVGAFTVALAASATGIRDLAGNLASFAATAPADGAAPYLLTGGRKMYDVDANGKIDSVTVDFSETLAAYIAGTVPWTLANVPSDGTLASAAVSGSTATLTIGEGAGAASTAVGTFTIALVGNANGIRDAADNLSSFAAGAPADKAKPVPLTTTMIDNNANGKVDRVTVVFSESLSSYTAGTAPWTLASVPSAGTLASVTVSSATVTLTITEGAGVADTSVGGFTIALATNAAGIRDAAANLASFAATSPLDGAKPIVVTPSRQMFDTDVNGKIDQLTVTFSEMLAPYTAGTAPWTLANVPSGGTLASVTVSGSTATLTISEGAGAASTAVGTFTIALATNANGIRDAANNLSSMAAAAPTDKAAPALLTMTMQDAVTVNGKVDRVTTTWSESLTTYTAGTTPWTLANVPSGGTLASASVSSATATLTIAEGAGAQDTAVGSFTIALATNAAGVRDAAGNLSSFTTRAPADGAAPYRVTGSLQMQDTDANGKVDQVTVGFSETLASYTAGTTPWTLTNVPSAGSLSSVGVSGSTVTLTIAEGAGAASTAVGTFTVALATNAAGVRDAGANLSSFAATAPADAATPVRLSTTMQDANANGKVDRVTVVFSETLAAYTAGTTPWTLANIPSGGTLASVSVATTTATLTIAEGSGAADTAVGSLTVALATSPTGIRDAAGNLASFAGLSPSDGAGPVVTGIASTNAGLLAGLMEAGDSIAVTFSEAIATSVGPTTTITETDPSTTANDTLTIGALISGAANTGSNLYVVTDATSASFAASALAAAGAVVTATVGGTCSGSCALGAGTGALVLTPGPALKDGAGNAAAGTFTTATTFKIF